MSQILSLDSQTIDKIAAGEVVEKPASVVKELVENAIDSGADSIVVEIKNGGIEMIRVTDNGCGIEKSQVPMAFLRHATSKITNVDDLYYLNTLGFRGEALASISAVAKVEMITKTEDELTGLQFLIEGGVPIESTEVGAPNGTTIIVRNLFFNTPARRKFLKTAATEGAYITELMQHMALSMPNLSIKLIVNNLTRFHTSGNGDLKEVIYRIYGRDMAVSVIPIQYNGDGIVLEGYLGKPEIARATRNYENYFINRRFVKSELISSGIEEAYKNYVMQHRFPFCALHINVDTTKLDVNVHPTKMEVRLSDQERFLTQLTEALKASLSGKELIPSVKVDETPSEEPVVEVKTPEPFETRRLKVEDSLTNSESSPEDNQMPLETEPEEENLDELEASYDEEQVEELTFLDGFINESEDKTPTDSKDSLDIPQGEIFRVEFDDNENSIAKVIGDILHTGQSNNQDIHSNIIKQKDSVIVEKPEQMELFESHILTKEAFLEMNILGQIFKTYWLIEYDEKLFIVDQHAAHEKVKYEEFIKNYHEHSILSQNIVPPIILALQPAEREALVNYYDKFHALGFEFDDFGGNEFAIRAVPMDLYGCKEKELFLEILDEIASERMLSDDHDVICRKIASMACKAAVKGNTAMTVPEVKELITKMLELDNPYNCPHGRPTMISLSKYEIEKKFKRVVS